jgi:hypothetical protein
MATDLFYDSAPSVAHDGNGHWILVWSSDNDLSGTINSDEDILYATSADGVTWSAPAALNSDAAVPDALDDSTPRIMYDGSGRWLVVWYYGDYDIDYDIKFAYSDDNGATWSDAEYLNTNALTDTGRDLHPELTTNGSGTWVVVWQSKEPLTPYVMTDYDIFYACSADNGETWSPPALVNTYGDNPYESAGYDRDPQVAWAGGSLYRAVWGTDWDFTGTLTPKYDLAISSAFLPLCLGDLDGDYVRDLTDFAMFAAAYGSVLGNANYNPDADMDSDGVVDLTDFAAFAAVYGVPCP